MADKTGEPALVIGSDTVVASGNKILGKPHDKEEAFRMLKELQGASHMVYTGVAVIDTVTGRAVGAFRGRDKGIHVSHDGRLDSGLY